MHTCCSSLEKRERQSLNNVTQSNDKGVENVQNIQFFFVLLNSSYVLSLPNVQILQTKAKFTIESALNLFKGHIKIFKQGTTHTSYSTCMS